MEKLPNMPWQSRAAVKAVLAAFDTVDTPIRFVGGCVRDALLGGATRDTECDMATPATPDVVMAILEKAGLKAVPTGLAFGTITAVHDCDKVEITTLRRDVETDGRHAVVTFGTSWEDDAARRDFTLNALYADADGMVHDYTGGVADARANRVRFIGVPAARIREDYLRILRFFRFSARFADTPDTEGLTACMQERRGLERLAAERVWMELGKILTLSKPLRALQPMMDAGVMEEILPDANNLAHLCRMADYEHDVQADAVPVMRLAALCHEIPGTLQKTLKLSNREAAWLDVTAQSLKAQTLRELRVLWYHHADALVPHGWLGNLALLLMADDDVRGRTTWPVDLYALATSFSAPIFPLAGADVLALGVEAGPKVGILLNLVETWWIEKNFTPTRDECLNYLKKAA